MRWFIEVTPLGTTSPGDRFCIEATRWQAALQAVRRARDEKGSFASFYIELVEQGYRALHPESRTRYVVTRAPDDAAVTPGLAAIYDSLPPSEPPPSKAPMIARRAAHAGNGKAPGSVAFSTDLPTQRSGAAQLPPYEIFRRREEEPTPKVPMVYREHAIVVPPGTDLDSVALLLWDRFRDVAKSLEDRAKGKFVQIAVFDHRFDERPESPPLGTLLWKDWRGNPALHFPGSPDRDIVRAWPENGEVSAPAVAQGPVAAPAVVPRPVAAKPQPPSRAVEPTPPPVAEPPTPPPVAIPVPPMLRAEPATTRAPAIAPPSPPIAPPVAAPAAPMPIALDASVVAPPAARVVAAPMPLIAPAVAAPASMPIAPAVADPPVPAPFAAPAAPIPVAPAAPLPVPPAPSMLVDQAPPATMPVAPSTAAFAGVVAPAPVEAAPARRHSEGEDLIGDLFESMHDLNFVQDIVSGSQFVLGIIARTLPADLILIHVFDINSGHFVIVRAHGSGADALILHRTPDSDPLFDSVMRRSGSLHLSDTSGDPRYQGGRWSKTGVVPKCTLCGGVKQGGRYLGAIEVVNPLGGEPFHASEINALDYICEQFAEFLVARPIVVDAEVVMPNQTA